MNATTKHRGCFVIIIYMKSPSKFGCRPSMVGPTTLLWYVFIFIVFDESDNISISSPTINFYSMERPITQSIV